MSELFNRRVELLIGPKGKDGRLIKDLRMVFRVEKNLEKHPNNARIAIYNLSPDSRSVIQEKGSALRLRAGYIADEILGDLFVGDVASVTTKKQGPDIITEVESADGVDAYQTKDFNYCFKGGVKFGQILGAIRENLGLDKGSFIGINEDEIYKHGFSFCGPTKDALDSILKKQKLTWSIQNNKLQILPGVGDTGEPAVLLNPSTGLINSPFIKKVLNSELAKKKDNKEAESGVKVLSLLNSRLVPGRLIKLEALLVKGNFRIEKVMHSGDTHGAAYQSEVDAK